MSNFSHSETRKARKLHQCFGCGDAIAIGTSYRYSVGKFDGDMFSVCEHFECHKMFAACSSDEGVGENYALEFAREHSERKAGETNFEFVKRVAAQLISYANA